MTKIAAIFDLDDTLISESSGTMIFRYLRNTGQLWRYFRRRDIPPMLVHLLGWQLGLVETSRLLEQFPKAATGVDVEELWAIIRAWFNEMVVDTISEEARATLAWHQREGHVPIICSAASQFSVRPVAEHLGILHAICSEWLDVDGRLTGKVQLPIVYGAGKVHWMRQWAAANNVDLAQSYFYSDHHSDQPLLEAVAHPVAVNPNKKLMRIAEARGWTIARWRSQLAT